jgi:peroxisomal 2,4-dienoyl-CoA reductase
MEIDAFGVFNMAQAAFPALQAAYLSHGDALVLNISAEYNRPPFFQMHAAAAKMAINSMTKSLALEWADYGIRSCAIAPGVVADTAGGNLNTTKSDSKSNMNARPSAGGAQAAARPPLPRSLQPGRTWDVAMAALYLASPAAIWVSGEIMNVDGGQHLQTGLRRTEDGHLKVDRQRFARKKAKKKAKL